MKRAAWHLLAVLAVAGCFFANWRLAERRHAREAAERLARLGELGISGDGESAYVALPRALPVRERVALVGENLFHCARFGLADDRACGTCHALSSGGADGNIHGGRPTRPICDVSLQKVFLHDGSETNLAAVVRRMIHGKDFIAFPAEWELRGRVGGGLRMGADFAAAFGADWGEDEVLAALCEYPRTLLTSQTAYDEFRNGHASALGREARRGFDEFRDLACIRCHSGPAMGGERAEAGVKVPALRGLSRRPAQFLGGRRCADLGEAADAMPGVKRLSESRRRDLLAFLRTL